MSLTNLGQTCQKFSFVLVMAGGRGCDRSELDTGTSKMKFQKGRGFKSFKGWRPHTLSNFFLKGCGQRQPLKHIETSKYVSKVENLSKGGGQMGSL